MLQAIHAVHVKNMLSLEPITKRACMHALHPIHEVFQEPPCFGMDSIDDFLMSSNSSVRAISSSLAGLPRVHMRASRASSCLPASSSHLGDSGSHTCSQVTVRHVKMCTGSVLRPGSFQAEA